MSGARLTSSVRLAAALLASLAVVYALVEVLGASAPTTFKALVEGAFGTPLNLGQTIMLASILSLTGLAAAVPFTASMWNVGAEGQLYAGAVAAVAVGFELEGGTPRWLLVALLLVAGTLAGAFWGGMPGLMKARWGANEVITSLMFFFVARLIVEYSTITLWPSGLSLATKDLPVDALLPTLSQSTQVTLGAILAAGAVGIAWIVMARGTLGFQIRAAGLNERAAAMNGVPVARIQVLSFMIGGAAAGLAGAILVAGLYGGLIAGSAAGFGFLGIAVALVARLSPAGIIPAAVLFAALHVGGNALQAKAGISSAVGDVLVGVFVVALLGFGVIRLRYPEAMAE